MRIPLSLPGAWARATTVTTSIAAATLMLAGTATIEPAFAQKTGSIGSYASSAGLARVAGGRSLADIKPASKTLKLGLNALDKNDTATALRARSALRAGTLERKIMAWAIAVDGNNVPAETLVSIMNDLSHWPRLRSMRLNVEKALAKSGGSEALRIAFSQSLPEDIDTAIKVARAYASGGDKARARQAIASHWRASKLTKSQEATILSRLGNVLTRDDHRERVEYLLGKNRLRAAQRIAGRAGMTRLVNARVAVHRKQANAAKALAAVPGQQKTHPNYLFSKAKYLRRKGQISNAANTLLSIDTRQVRGAASDELWIEKRILSSDLLEAGKSRLAYKLASRNVAGSPRRWLDAEFYAGWIALRKRNAPKVAIRHFERLVSKAGTPLSKSRGHYWSGRAFEAMGQKSSANTAYTRAARYDTSYYGQLAALKLGRKGISISRAGASAQDRASFARYEFTQAIAKLESAGHPRRARTFYRHLAGQMKNPGEIALLALRAEKRRDYQLSLQVGKRAFIRGMDVDTLAWPLGAISKGTKTSGPGLPMAYAIARQESTFQIDARSSADALGLMQLLPGTAKRVARGLGLKYSRRRLVTDGSYNARLGTAYLDQQMDKFGGSFILTFSAYNAGPRRASEWIERFGDPRGKPLDFVIDWVEQIPFSETRNYVQRVMENYQVYKTRIKGERLTIDRDLRAGRS